MVTAKINGTGFSLFMIYKIKVTQGFRALITVGYEISRLHFYTGGDNSNKRCLSNTACNSSPPGKLKYPPEFFGDIPAKLSNFPKMSRKYVMFPGRIPESPDSRQNLQIPGKILFFSRNRPC